MLVKQIAALQRCLRALRDGMGVEEAEQMFLGQIEGLLNGCRFLRASRAYSGFGLEGVFLFLIA
jgi:hypothetical protein